MTDAARALDPTRRVTTPIAEEIRLRLADAWGEMGAAWGVAPAIARVHAYLMTRQEPLTEREVREALNLSHRAASLALAEAEAWGLVERVAEPRRVGKRGPAGTAYMAIGDHWRWFGRVVAERKVREGDPIIVVLEKTLTEANLALATHPGDQDLIVLRDWLSTFLVFVRLFDRAVGLVSRLEPTELERALRLLGDVPDDTILRLVKLLDGLPDDDVLGLVEALSRLSPSSARRATTLMSRGRAHARPLTWTSWVRATPIRSTSSGSSALRRARTRSAPRASSAPERKTGHWIWFLFPTASPGWASAPMSVPVRDRRGVEETRAGSRRPRSSCTLGRARHGRRSRRSRARRRPAAHGIRALPRPRQLFLACTEHGMRTTGMPEPGPWRQSHIQGDGCATPSARSTTGTGP